MKGWMPKMMAVAGRLALTRSVLMALPMHFMAALPLPAWATKVINRRCRGFLWKGEEDISGGHCLMPWARVCMPKELGGLGVINLKYFGIALRCRWPWLRWEEEARPWQGLPDTTEKEVDAIVHAACRIKLGNGELAKFWTDKWLPDGRSIAEMAPQLFSFVKDKGQSVMEALSNHAWTREIAGVSPCRLLHNTSKSGIWLNPPCWKGVHVTPQSGPGLRINSFLSQAPIGCSFWGIQASPATSQFGNPRPHHVVNSLCG